MIAIVEHATTTEEWRTSGKTFMFDGTHLVFDGDDECVYLEINKKAHLNKINELVTYLNYFSDNYDPEGKLKNFYIECILQYHSGSKDIEHYTITDLFYSDLASTIELFTKEHILCKTKEMEELAVVGMMIKFSTPIVALISKDIKFTDLYSNIIKHYGNGEFVDEYIKFRCTTIIKNNMGIEDAEIFNKVYLDMLPCLRNIEFSTSGSFSRYIRRVIRSIVSRMM